MNKSLRTMLAALMTVGLLTGLLATAGRAEPPVPVHCIGVAVPDATAQEPEGQEDDASADDPVNDTIDPVPGPGEVCLTDEALAWDLAGQGSTRVAKYWTKTGFSGSSLVLIVDNSIDGGDGCADGDKYGFASLGAFNNEIESAKGFNGCTTLRFFNYKGFGGSTFTCATPCSTLGSFNNKPGSTKVKS